MREKTDASRNHAPLLTTIIAATLALWCFSAFSPPEVEARRRGGDQAKAARRGEDQAKARRHGGNLAKVAENALESVVNISSTKVTKLSDLKEALPFHNDELFRKFFGPGFEPRVPRERRVRSLGSGVIVSADGIVLTNNHVIERAKEIQVTLSDGRQVEAKVLGGDPKSDLAVLRLEGEIEGLAALPYGDSNKLRLAETVLAIGNPFGVGQTVTKGIVSAKGRANVGIVDYEDFIQTDAAINPGNSGGALINTSGELVGINTAIMSRSGGHQGVGFAIPSNMVKTIAESLITHGKVVRGWLGVMIQQITNDLAEALGLEDVKGVLIADVTADSPAAKAGLKVGDVIVRVNRDEIETTGQLRNIIAGAGAVAKVKIGVLREGEPMTLKVTLAELPPELAGPSGPTSRGESLGGLTLDALTDEHRKGLEVPEKIEAGVVVTDVDRESAAFAEGIRPGDVILELDRDPVDSPERFAELYKAAEERVLLLVFRGGGTRFAVLSK